MKDILFDKEAQNKMLEGVNLVVKAVASTLGPKGRNAVLSRETAQPVITNDGVTIASFFNTVKDPFINTGVQMIKEVSAKANEVGDGTTTSTVVAGALVSEGVMQIASGRDPIEIKEGIIRASKSAIEKLKKMAKPVKEKEELVQVATISVEDDEMGKMIGEMMFEVGKDGAITVETSKDVKLEKDNTKGIKFDQGWIVPYFMTNPYRQEAVYEDVPILVTDYEITVNEEFVPLVDSLLEKNIHTLVIVCDNMKGEALATAVNNSINPEVPFSFLVIRAPGLDDWRKKHAEDIATATGAKFISKDLGRDLTTVTLEDLGSCGKIISRRDHTIIVNGGGTEKEIKNKIKILREEFKAALSEFERDQIKERIARLSGGIGVIRIGAATEQELTYKKHKIEDALSATRVAMEEGIVPGGGVALLRLSNVKTSDIGEQILYSALKAPIAKIADNAGKNGDTVIEKVLEMDQDFGWDAKKDEYKNMVESGIIDPLKVVRKVIENAASMASMFLTSSCVIVEMPEDKKEPMPGRVR